MRHQMIDRGKDFAFETVLSTPRNLELLKLAKERGYEIVLFYVSTEDPNINVERVAKRVSQGGHDVPITKIISRFQKSIANANLLAKIVDRAYFYDNSIDNEDAKLLFRLSEGKLAKQYTESIPEWAGIILNNVSSMNCNL